MFTSNRIFGLVLALLIAIPVLTTKRVEAMPTTSMVAQQVTSGGAHPEGWGEIVASALVGAGTGAWLCGGPGAVAGGLTAVALYLVANNCVHVEPDVAMQSRHSAKSLD